MRSNWQRALTGLAVAVLVGCGTAAVEKPRMAAAGGISISIKTMTTLQAPIDSVMVRIDSGTPVAATLGGGVYTATFNSIEAGNHTVTVEALAGETTVASGSAQILVAAHKLGHVSLFLYDERLVQQGDTLPIVEAVVADSLSVFSDEKVHLGATVISFDGGPVAYLWDESAPCGGSFDDPSSATPTWTPPAWTGNCTLHVVVSEAGSGHSDGEFSSAFVVVHVDNTGSVEVRASIVSPPQVSSMVLSGPNGLCTILPGSDMNPNVDHSNCGDWLNFFLGGDVVTFTGYWVAPPAGVNVAASATLTCDSWAPAPLAPVPTMVSNSAAFQFVVPAKPAYLFSLACKVDFTLVFSNADGSVSSTLPLVFGVP